MGPYFAFVSNPRRKLLLFEVAGENAFDKIAKLHEFIELRRFAKIAVRAESFHEFPVALGVRG